eukprot:jgi/Mesvir1/24539/Mv21873-RA.1
MRRRSIDKPVKLHEKVNFSPHVVTVLPAIFMECPKLSCMLALVRCHAAIRAIPAGYSTVQYGKHSEWEIGCSDDYKWLQGASITTWKFANKKRLTPGPLRVEKARRHVLDSCVAVTSKPFTASTVWSGMPEQTLREAVLRGHRERIKRQKVKTIMWIYGAGMAATYAFQPIKYCDRLAHATQASTCSACGCSFNLIRRKHHCRQCGGTFCSEHSSKTRPLPQYGLVDPVRVCEDCFSRPDSNDSSDIDSEHRAAIMDNLGEGSDLGPGGLTPASPLSPSSVDGTERHAEIGWGAGMGRRGDSRLGDANTTTLATPTVVECTCGMPLCICAQAGPAPAAEPVEIQARPRDAQRAKDTPEASNRKPAVSRQPPDASSSGMPSLFFTSSAAQGPKSGASSRDGNSATPPVDDYEPSEEGVREAIMKGDLAAVTRLMAQHDLDANYMDGNNMTLLHVAAMFNRTDIVFALLKAGADPTIENGQGETPVDCAPAMLQAKMRAHVAAMPKTAEAQ